VGGDVGNLAPAFTLKLADGSTVDQTALLAQGKPLLLYFFATWWPVCRAEFRTLKTVYPEYEDEITLIGVGFGSGQTIGVLEEYRQQNGIPWAMAEGGLPMLVDYEVRTQSTKVGMDARGVILFRKGYSANSADDWRGYFQSIIQ
jgi:thiol-disulfide isomerase/thioredoxin